MDKLATCDKRAGSPGVKSSMWGCPARCLPRSPLQVLGPAGSMPCTRLRSRVGGLRRRTANCSLQVHFISGTVQWLAVCLCCHARRESWQRRRKRLPEAARLLNRNLADLAGAGVLGRHVQDACRGWGGGWEGWQPVGAGWPARRTPRQWCELGAGGEAPLLSPLASMEKDTLIFGTPRGAGGMPSGEAGKGLMGCQRWMAAESAGTAGAGPQTLARAARGWAVSSPRACMCSMGSPSSTLWAAAWRAVGASWPPA